MAESKRQLSEAHKQALRRGFENMSAESHARMSRPLSEAHKQALRKGHKQMAPGSRARMSRGKGPINHHWNGGNWRYWKNQALKRDNYTCQLCSFSEREIMEVDHIKPRAEFPELRFELSNLVTLCPNCHRRKTIMEHKARAPWNKGTRKTRSCYEKNEETTSAHV